MPRLHSDRQTASRAEPVRHRRRQQDPAQARQPPPATEHRPLPGSQGALERRQTLVLRLHALRRLPGRKGPESQRRLSSYPGRPGLSQPPLDLQPSQQEPAQLRAAERRHRDSRAAPVPVRQPQLPGLRGLVAGQLSEHGRLLQPQSHLQLERLEPAGRLVRLQSVRVAATPGERAAAGSAEGALAELFAL